MDQLPAFILVLLDGVALGLYIAARINLRHARRTAAEIRDLIK